MFAQVAELLKSYNDVALLASDEVADISGHGFLERPFVAFGRTGFAEFGGSEQALIAGAELCFQIAPGTMKRAADGSALFDVMFAHAMELVFEFGGEFGADLTFAQEKLAGGFVFEALAEIHHALVSILKNFNEVEQQVFCLSGNFPFGHAFLHRSEMRKERAMTRPR